MKDLARKADRFEATVVNDASASGSVSVGGVFTVECYDAAGQLKWKDEFHNLVVNQGLKDMNDKYFTGSGYTAAWYIGLINNSPSPTLAAGNTAAGITTNASGSNVWAEFTGYSQANRPTLSFSASTTADPSVISTASAAAFSITSTATIYGAFVVSNNTKGGTSGVLFSEGAFAATRSVVNGDTLNVSYSLSNDAA
jgi:hypothetical protein